MIRCLVHDLRTGREEREEPMDGDVRPFRTSWYFPGLAKYEYLLVLERGDRSLFTAMATERMAGYR